MLTISCLCSGGERLSLPTPVYLELCRDADVPADSLRVIFPCSIREELAEIYITYDEQEIFCGVVDEQILISYETEQTEVIGRSMAAVLLDNEARPHNFVNLCTQVLFERYMKPYGIDAFYGENKRLQGNFDVLKGTSCWQVAENFGKKLFGVKPEIKGKSIDFSAQGRNKEIVFSNEGEGVPFTGFELCKLRCKLISKVRAKTETRGEYNTIVSDAEAVNSAVVRERFLDVSQHSGDTLIKAYETLKKASQSSEKITLKCPVQLANSLYAEAKVISDYGVYEKFRVKSLRYVMGEHEESTRITLCRREK